MDIRIPSRSQILENPVREAYIAGGWVNGSDPEVAYLYWRRSKKHFTVYSILQILEHETLHSALAKVISLKTSAKLDNIHQSAHTWINGRLIYVNKFKIRKWVLPPYFRRPTKDLLD